MISPKISVIIPVYNVEKYLRKCLDTIILQTYTNLEIICINDGSTDSSEQILNEYEQNDSRVIVVNQENSGQSAARNKGLEIATGDYISFIDSDDWVSLSLYQKFIDSLNSLNSSVDIYLFNAQMHPIKLSLLDISEKNMFNIKKWKIQNDKLLYSVDDCSNPFDANMSACNKIYKKSYLDSLNLKFEENLIFEDKVFHFESFLRTKKIYINNEPLYHYRQHSDSTMHTIKNNVFDVFKVVLMIEKALLDSETYEKNKYAFFQFFLRHFVYLLFASTSSDKEKLYIQAKEFLMNFEKNNLEPKIFNRLKGIETYYDFINLSYENFMKKYNQVKNDSKKT